MLSPWMLVIDMPFKDPIKRKEYNKKFHSNEYHRNYRKKNRAKRRAYEKQYKQNNPEKQLLSNAKQRAKKIGLPFNITLEDIFIPDYCPILGIKLGTTDGGKGQVDDSPSLDRIRPEEGYVKGNIAVISMRANVIKNSGSAEEHRKIADWIERH